LEAGFVPDKEGEEIPTHLGPLCEAGPWFLVEDRDWDSLWNTDIISTTDSG
jgi:hypothetical protein